MLQVYKKYNILKKMKRVGNSLSMEIDNKNQSLETGTLYGYNVVLMDNSGIPSYDNIDGLTITCDTATKTASVTGNTITSGNGEVVIPRFVKSGDVICEVTSIGNSAFYGCSSLTSITIPNSVTSIGDSAFFGCGFTSITIPDSVTSLGWGPFKSCEKLTTVIIGSGVTSLPNECFDCCFSLTSVTFGTSITRIHDTAFSHMSQDITIYYKGTQEEWNTYLGEDELAYKTNITIQFNA